MKLTVLTDECPFPAIHGGRVDVWRRLQAFAAEDVKLQLIFWYAENDIPNQTTLEEIKKVCDFVLAFPISRSWKAHFKVLTKLASQSLYISTRQLNSQLQHSFEREVSRFSPDGIWLDGLFAGKIAVDLARRLSKPLFNRSRNIEFKYRQMQYERALGWRAKLIAWMVKLHLESFEQSVLNRAEMTWDISLDDLQYWQNRGVKKLEWLPPFADQSLIDELQIIKIEPEFDFVYLGNLFTPNNIEGVSWFLQEVFPNIRAKKPESRFLLAGMTPHHKIRQLSNIEGVTLLPDAPEVADVYARGRILINPILAGSGVNVKSVEMLFSGKPVITCPQGAAGLPAEIRAYFKIADTSQEFAELCLSALDNLTEERLKRDLSPFTFQAIKPVVKQMQALMKKF